MYIKMLAEYCKCAFDIPAIATDVLSRIFEILIAFNDRVKELVLHAKALRVIGSKTITAKHLALSLSSLSAIILLFPDLKARFAINMNEKLQVIQ